MPPKGSRGTGTARGARRERGTARGRGGAAAASAPTPAPEPAVQDEPESKSSTIEGSPPPAALSQPAPVAPQTQLNDAPVPSPNSSPATIPTETPASTPLRPGPTSNPNPENTVGTIAMHTASTRGGAVARGSTRGGRGAARGASEAAAVAKSRFKPKITRRDIGEREEAARKEQERLDQIAAIAAKAEARAARGRGRGGRGRGDAMGRGAGMIRTSAGTASGIFGVVPEGLGKAPGIARMYESGGSGSSSGAGGTRNPNGEGASRYGGGGGSGGGGGGGGDSGGGGGGGGFGGGSGHGGDYKYDYEPTYPDEDIREPKIDIEHINDPEEEDPVITAIRARRTNGPGTRAGLKPIRLHREEHKERIAVLNTDPVIKDEPADEDEDMLQIDEAKSSKPLDATDDAVRIKNEPELDPSLRDLSEVPSVIVPDSPESKRNRKALVRVEDAMDVDPSPEDEALAKTKRARRNSKKDNKPVIQTEEDREEYERHLEDIATLVHELGSMQGNLNARSRDAEGDVGMAGVEGVEAEEDDQRAGRLYLFQFPPVLPQLYNPDTQPELGPKIDLTIEEDESKVKDEKGKDVALAEVPAAKLKLKSAMKQPIDLTGAESSSAVKLENPGLTAAELKKLGEDKKKKKKGKDLIPEEGYIGKLIVRESGKVELCWGGTSLVVGRGVSAGFLTTGVVVDTIERGPPGGGAPEGKALGMGPIMGKFVVTPDWEKMT